MRASLQAAIAALRQQLTGMLLPGDSRHEQAKAPRLRILD